MMSFSKEILARYYGHRVSRSAAELTYYLLFTIFPLLIFFSSVISRFNISESAVYERLSFILPEELLSLISEYLSYAKAGSESNRAFFLYAGSILVLYMLFRSITSLNYAVRRALNVPPKRGAAWIAMSLAICIFLLILLTVLLVLLSISREVYSYAGAVLGIELQPIANVIRYAAGPALIFLALWAYYYFVSGKKYKLKGCIGGAAIAAVLLFASSMIFALYFNNFADIGRLYGSLGSFILLLLWLHLTGTVLILGAEIMAVINGEPYIKHEVQSK